MYPTTWSRVPSRPLTAAFFLLVACDGGPTEPVAFNRPTISFPEQPVVAQPFYQGVFLGDAETTPENVGGAIADFTRLVGTRPALVKTFFRLESDFSATGWAGRVVRQIDAAGATNFIALDLRWSSAPNSGLLDAILAGAADAQLQGIAREVAALGRTVLLEPGWEMNGDWSYPWQGAANGAAVQAPARFVAAWRHIVDTFRAAGATNVLWVFSPNVGNPIARAGAGSTHWNWYGHYYPGDAYVDYVGAHGFHAPTLWGGPYTDFNTLFDGAYADRILTDLSSRFPNKPILIGEFAAEESPGREKGDWVRDAFAAIHARPQIAGAVWFHMKKEADWRVDSSAGALAAYRAAQAHPRTSVAFTPPSTGGMLLANN
jgi:endoglucanase